MRAPHQKVLPRGVKEGTTSLLHHTFFDSRRLHTGRRFSTYHSWTFLLSLPVPIIPFFCGSDNFLIGILSGLGTFQFRHRLPQVDEASFYALLHKTSACVLRLSSSLREKLYIITTPFSFVCTCVWWISLFFFRQLMRHGKGTKESCLYVYYCCVTRPSYQQTTTCAGRRSGVCRGRKKGAVFTTTTVYLHVS